MENRQVNLAEVLKRVREDEDEKDAGRAAKRQETEELRRALMQPVPPSSTSAASVVSSSGSTNAPFGIREGQTVVRFPGVEDSTGARSRARADGIMWDPIGDRDAMQRQPYNEVLTEMGRIQSIIERNPNKRFLNMYAAKTNQRIQALYDQDKLRVLASRESELAHARRLDRERKIVDAPAKERQLAAMRKELSEVQARHDMALSQAPRMSTVNSRLGDYLDVGQSENEETFEYFLNTRELALFADRMAELYSSRNNPRRPLLDKPNITTDDGVQLRMWVERIWGGYFDAGAPPDDKADNPPVPENLRQEQLKMDGKYLKDEANLDDVLEMFLAGYGLYMCHTINSDVDAPVYASLAMTTLKKALNFFFVGLVETTDQNERPRNYADFQRLMGPYSKTRYSIGTQEEPYDPDAASSLVEQIQIAVDRIVDKMEVENPIGVPRLKVEDSATQRRTAALQSATAYINRLNASIIHLALRLDLLDNFRKQDNPVDAFSMDLLRLFLDVDPESMRAFAAWRQREPRSRLSSVLTKDTGAFVHVIASGVANTLTVLRKENPDRDEAAFIRKLSRHGMVAPSILEDVFQVLQIALAGFLSELYAYLVQQRTLILDEDVLGYFRMFQRDPIIPVVALEATLLTSIEQLGGPNPLRLMFTTYALNKAADADRVRLLKLLNTQKSEVAAAALKRASSTEPGRNSNNFDTRRMETNDEYTDVDIYEALPAAILMHLARTQLRLAQFNTDADRLLMEKLQRDIREAEHILSDITAERTARHGILHPGDADAFQNQRDTYQQPLAWAQLPEISGFVFLSPNVTGQYESARITLGVDVPALRDIPLETLTTDFESGLAAHFCEYAAVMHARDELSHSTNVIRDKQFMLNKLRRVEIVSQLKHYSYSKVGNRITVYCDGRVYAPPRASTPMGSVPSVGLF